MANYDDSHIYILTAQHHGTRAEMRYLPSPATSQIEHRQHHLPKSKLGIEGAPKGREGDVLWGQILLWQRWLWAPLPEANPGPPPARRHLPLGQSSGGLGLKLYTSLWEGSCQPKSWPLSFGNSIRDKKELWTPTCSQMWPLLVSPSLCAKLSWPDKCAVGHGGHFQKFLS